MPIPLIGGGPPYIEGDDQKRALKCNEKINMLLKQYDCVIVPQFVITGTELTTGWMIGALPREPNGERKKVVPLGNRGN